MLSEGLPTLQYSNTPSHLFSDYHTHPQGHRVQRYTQHLLQPWADSARSKGLTDIAFTDHDRYHAGIDLGEIDRLRERKIDFVLGSVHFLDRADQMFDSVPDGAAQFEGRSVDATYADYFRRVREITATGLIDCLAHLDLIKIHGHRPDTEIGSLVNETLDFIRARNLAIELSTAGWRKPVNELYPGDAIIELAIEKGIPFTTGSEAHSHVQLGDGFSRLAQKVANFGIREEPSPSCTCECASE